MPSQAFDARGAGGVSRIVLDPASLEPRSTNLVLAGTVMNCAGGASPWGWLTCEELWWDAQGRLRTVGPSTYKIPGSRDVPPKMNLRLLEGAPARAETIFRSKAVGEPPLLLATSVWNALKDAIGTPELDLPATPERVLMALRRKG